MRIGLDANWAIYDKTGIGKYSENLIKNLLQQDSRNEYVLFFNFFKKPRERMRQIKTLTEGAKAKVTIEVTALPSLMKYWLSQTNLSLKFIYKQEVDVFHALYFAGLPKIGFSKTVVTIQDLAFLKFPEHRGLKISKQYERLTKRAIKKASKIIVPSFSTRKDLKNLLNADLRKIEVIPDAAAEEFRVIADQKEIKKRLNQYFPPSTNYIFALSTLEPRKNFARLIRAYSLLPYQLQRKYKLVIAGNAGWNNREIFENIDNLNLKEKVILPGFVAQEDLPCLYCGASCFVYPSLYEGFGLPILEAFACGVPVISSKISSIPEVAGRAAILVNPVKEEEIALALKKLLLSEKLRKTFRSKGFKQVKKFSWQKTALQTIKVYEKVKKMR